jgi:DNA-binding transcriptional LysR family regulator
VIDLRSLEVFYWVVKLGGFGRAAERLHMTQPAVSNRVRQMEDRFGARLLDRDSHRAPLATPKGLELFSYAERMLALRTEAVACLGEAPGLSGTVRLGTAETLVHTLLGGLIRLLHQRHPKVTPEITVDISPNLQSSLLAGELDVAFLLGPLNEPRVRNVALRDYALIWVISPDSAGGTVPTGPLSPADLARWPILSYARGTQPHTDIVRLFTRAHRPPPRIFANSSLASIRRMALDGIGIGTLPDMMVAEDVAAGRLIQLDVTPGLPPLRFTASYVATPGSGLAEQVAELAGELARAV